MTHSKSSMPCNKPRKSNRPGKKRMVKACSGGKEKLIHYGATGYGHNYSTAARKSFRARHKCDSATDKLTARYWACKDLWTKGGDSKACPSNRNCKYSLSRRKSRRPPKKKSRSPKKKSRRSSRRKSRSPKKKSRSPKKKSRRSSRRKSRSPKKSSRSSRRKSRSPKKSRRSSRRKSRSRKTRKSRSLSRKRKSRR